jgi:hypothetical protein
LTSSKVAPTGHSQAAGVGSFDDERQQFGNECAVDLDDVDTGIRE